MHLDILSVGPIVKEAMMTSIESSESGRPAQRRRTRKAIVEATMELLASGSTPTVAEIADAADVSRRTVYLHFPTLEQLLIDATLGALSQAQVDSVLRVPELSDDVDARVEAMVRALQSMSPEVERLGRSLIRLTIEPEPAGTRPVGTPSRGYRRVEWIETALGPLRDELAPEAFTRLVSGLAMVVGWEPLIVQRDILGLSAEQGEELSVWAARALLHAALAEPAQTEAGSTGCG
jgi:AcrR family transcriptional regulator